MRGLYIHIPFCNSICSYCDFTKRVSSQKVKEDYLNYLISEFDKYKKYYNQEIDSIYIGGGTPNCLDDEMLKRILEKIKSLNLKNVLEYAIEINPELLTYNQAKIFKEYGINRISIGAQTFHADLLKFLNRHHTYDNVKDAIQILKLFDITNINIDMMFGIPNQTKKMLLDDLRRIKSLNSTHVSYYNLILEEKTILYHLLKKKQFKLLDEDLSADMFELVIASLKKFGYVHYEISNFAKSGCKSIHNIHYWNCDEYIGLGCGASGYLDGIRYDNQSILSEYKKEAIQNFNQLAKKDLMSEFFIMGLRKIEGVNILNFKRLFALDPYEVFEIDKMIKECLLELNGTYLRFTHKGLFLGNIVFERFL